MLNQGSEQSDDEYQSAKALIERFKQNGDATLLAEIEIHLRASLSHLNGDDERRTARLVDLAMTLQLQNADAFSTAKLTEAIDSYRLALDLPVLDPSRASIATNLGLGLNELWSRTRDNDLIPAIVAAMQDAASSNAAGPPSRPERLINLGAALGTQYEHAGAGDPVEAVAVGHEAVSLVPQGHPVRASILSNLVAALRRLYQQSGELKDLNEAVIYGREAAGTARRHNHPQLPSVLCNLSVALQDAYRQTGDPAFITEAIGVGDEAAALPAANHLERVAILSNLSSAYQTRAELTGDATSAVSAVETSSLLFAEVGPDDPDRAWALSQHSESLRGQYLLSRHAGTLDEAVRVSRQAVDSCPEDSSKRAECLHAFGVALHMQAERRGSADLLAQAIEAGQEAMTLALDRTDDYAAIAASLGVMFQTQFVLTGDADALASAVEVGYRAVQTSRANPARHPVILNGLAGSLQLQADRHKDADLLSQAVAVGRQAVAASHREDPGRVGRISNLALGLRNLFEATGDERVLHEAADMLRAETADLSPSHQSYPWCMNSLVTVLRALFDVTRNVQVLVEAIDAGQRAAQAISADQGMYSTVLANLGEAHLCLYQQTGNPESRNEAYESFRSAGVCESGDLSARIASLRQAAVLASDGAAHAEAFALVEIAVELLPRLTSENLRRSDREYLLGKLGSLAGIVAAVSVDAGRPQRAVELLEQCRGVLVTGTLSARGTDTARLQQEAPDLAHAFTELRHQLDIVQGLPGALDGGEDRKRLQAAWSEIVSRIRLVDGFQDFMAPPVVERLARLAVEGPIVLVYASLLRCDALILNTDTADPVTVVPLTGFTESDLLHQVARLTLARQQSSDPRADPQDRIDAQSEILDALAWTWDVICGPVLTALGHTTQHDASEATRVWWCPVGAVTFLPLHAAGHHRKPDNTSVECRTVLDRVVSSYTTTLLGLEHARRLDRDEPNPATLVVSAPDVPDAPPLPGAQHEADMVATYLPNVEMLVDPTCQQVLDGLPRSRIVHFACHALPDGAEPAQSRILLRDHLSEPLTVAKLGSLRLPSGLAFLSACQTAVTVTTLADESVHATGALYLAGYNQVVGTLWPVEDMSAFCFSESFYAWLVSDGSGPSHTSRGFSALHHATLRMRDRFLQAPSIWAAYTHTGI
ncbi:hypothetical protein ABH935_005674 [Catenulispora sp. GAS73]|uniref:CHAT domain-containing protein n=1 Tax=Catenulispora sp. GAS73 TaxID=3156269 RepID=UPI0035193824